MSQNDKMRSLKGRGGKLIKLVFFLEYLHMFHDLNDYEADSRRKGLRKLREQHADSYSEKQRLSRAELEGMKSKISSIERL